MKRKSKIFAVFLVLAILWCMILSACGQKSTPPADTKPSEEPDKEAAVMEPEGMKPLILPKK